MKPGTGQIDGRLSFGPTTFRASDGCNSIDGSYVYVGGQIVVFSGSQTMAACDWPSLGWPGGTSDLMLSMSRLTITTRSIVHQYRRIATVPIGGPPPRPFDPNATAPFPSAAVFGSWNMESFSGGRTGPGAVGTIDFRADGSFLGETPCETVLGKWTQSAMSMATSIRSLVRLPTPCVDDLKPDALALGDLLSTSELAIGGGDVRLTSWKARSGGTNTGI